MRQQASGAPIALSSHFQIVSDQSCELLSQAMGRYSAIIAATSIVPSTSQYPLGALHSLKVEITSCAAAIGPDTSSAYTLRVTNGTAMAHSASVFGAMYALETFSQLVFQVRSPGAGLLLLYSDLTIEDTPLFSWRGLMVDTGRRFFPPQLLRDLLDTMAAVKMNVLHWHLSDYCRFSVESKRFPSLASAQQGNVSGAGYYTQTDVKAIVLYANARGIRVVPEVDLPGHARGLLPLEADGIEFCDPTAAWRNQIAPTDRSLAVLRGLLEEVASIFPDPVLHLGMDETASSADCPLNSTRRLERQLLEDVSIRLGKIPMGWEPVMDAWKHGRGYTMTNGTRPLVNAYLGAGSAAAAVARGFTSVDADSSAWYLTHPAGWDQDHTRCEHGCAGADGYAMAWRRPGGDGMPATGAQASAAAVLGGEVSMWSDDYCSPLECGAWSNRFPPSLHYLANASCLYTRARDVAFARSIAGVAWPRGLVAAGAFWGYDYLPSSVSAQSPTFGAAIDTLTRRLHDRGLHACRAGCACDYLSECGQRYEELPVEQVNGCYGGI